MRWCGRARSMRSGSAAPGPTSPRRSRCPWTRDPNRVTSRRSAASPPRPDRAAAGAPLAPGTIPALSSVYSLRNLYERRPMARNDALNGALPILVLKILDRRGPMHGYGITSHIESASDHLRVEEGSLYPALHRLEEAKLVRAKWAITANNRRARMYEITAAGRR